MATQFVGFGIAGLTRRFLIKPRAIFFPTVLSNIALYTTLHNPDKPSRWKMSRYKFEDEPLQVFLGRCRCSVFVFM